MIFPPSDNLGKYEYESNTTSLYKSNRKWIIKRIEGSEIWPYVIYIFEPQLKLRLISGKYKVNRNGAIEFRMTKETKRLDFFKIVSSVRMEVEARLYVEVRSPRLSFREWSLPFKVTPKKNSITDRKSKKNYTSINDDLLPELFDKLNMNDSLKDISDEVEFGTLAVEENQTCTSQSNAMDHSLQTCLCIVNQIDFKNDTVTRRWQSIQNVNDMLRIFQNISNCEIKIITNAIKEDLLKNLREFGNESLQCANQVIVIVMSHGQYDGFFTSDNELVTEKNLHDSLMPIMRHRDIKVMILLAACRTYIFRPSVAESNTSRNYDISSDESIDGDDSPVSDRLLMDESCPYPNVYLGHSSMPGQVSYRTGDGNLYINEILIGLERGIRNNGQVECVGVIQKVIGYFKYVPIKNDGKKVTQQPCKAGDIIDGMWIYQDGKNMDSGEDILGLSNLIHSEMDII